MSSKFGYKTKLFDKESQEMKEIKKSFVVYWFFFTVLFLFFLSSLNKRFLQVGKVTYFVKIMLFVVKENFSKMCNEFLRIG